MKKTLILVLLSTVLCNVFAQQNSHSRNGYRLPTQGEFRVFVVFAEMAEEDLNLQVPGWAKGQMPTQTTIDTWLNHTNHCFSEASFGKLNVILDYYPELMQITTTDQKPYGTCAYGAVFARLATLCRNGRQITTAGGRNFPNDFDTWTLTETTVSSTGGSISLLPQGSPDKAPVPDNHIDCILIFWRENSRLGTRGRGVFSDDIYFSVSIANKLVTMRGHIYADDPSFIVHEFAHGLVGGNSFHSAGANTNEQKIYLQNYSGNSILSGWARYFNGCNAWDRYWLGWKHQQKQHYISAQNMAGQEIASDLVYGQALPTGDSAVYVLRNFATSGDVIRIKLPYLRSENTNVKEQWLWIENRQFVPGTIEYSEHKHGSNSRMYKIPKGIYMNIQVGNNDLTTQVDSIVNIIYSGSAGNSISPINRFGNYDFTYSGNTAFMSAQTSNPFTGISFTSFHTIPISDTDTSLYHAVGNNTYRLNEKMHLTFNYNGRLMNNNNWASSSTEFHKGSVFDAFFQGDKISITTNPTPVPRMTFLTRNNVGLNSIRRDPQTYDNRKIYLNGLCIRVLQQMSNGDVRISIRWNDFAVTNDVRWCGDIVLHEQVNLQSGNTILLAQGLTPVRPSTTAYFNGKRVFADPTTFTCKQGSKMNLASQSKVILRDKSSFILESGSNLTIQDGAELIVEEGSTLIVRSGTNLNIQGSGKITVKPGGYLCVIQGANIQLRDYNSIIAVQPGALYGGNPVIWGNSSCLSPISFTGNGSIPNYNQDVYIQNETITTNRYIGGRNIYIGSNVTTSKPQGNVVIRNNANIIFDAAENVMFDSGFECTLGSSFEVKYK